MKIQNKSIFKKIHILARIKKSSENASISGKVAFSDDFFIRAKMTVYKKLLLFCIVLNLFIGRKGGMVRGCKDVNKMRKWK
jgi:hypothetical protein